MIISEQIFSFKKKRPQQLGKKTFGST
jgi:hypothetical protein